ncbi:MAG: MBL fold metallo-hydrolase [Lachnospiraceae bacterium]
MYELIQVGTHTYYIDSPSKVGVYVFDDMHVCLIDSGNDKDAAKKILKHLNAHNWKLNYIINTHSHADHCGGNAYLQQQTGCKVYCSELDNCFVNHPILEPSFLFGGYPMKELKNKFLYAKPSVSEVLPDSLDGLEFIRLDGHSFSMSGIKTPDGVWFLADVVSSVDTLEKYAITFLYNVSQHIESLEKLFDLEGTLFIPSHCSPMKEIRSLAQYNLAKIHELIEVIKDLCLEPITFEELLKKIFDNYTITMNTSQYLLIGDTVKAYLSYLKDKEEMCILFENNHMFWQSIKSREPF